MSQPDGDLYHQLGVGARLRKSPTDAMAGALNSELRYSPHIADGISCADLAHVIMLVEQRIIPAQPGAALLAALLELHAKPLAAIEAQLTAGDLYDHRDAWLRQRLGADSGWLHTARARREAINLGWLVGLKRGVIEVLSALSDSLETFTKMGARHQKTLMPDFTYLQHAHPTTLGHYLLGFAFPLERDMRRLADLLPDLDACPAGSASTNGTRLPVDRDRVRELLGFATLTVHNRDAMWQPDLAIALMSVLVSIYTTMDRLAEELILWSTAEFAFVSLSDAHCRTSVIMPQKKNPYALAHLRGLARAAIGHLVTVVSTNQTPSGQVDNRTAAYELLPRCVRETHDATVLLAEILENAAFNTDRLAAMASVGATWATEVVEFLVEAERVDARTAHSLIGAFTADLPPGVSEADLADRLRTRFADTIGRPLHTDTDTLTALFDPHRIVAARATPGSCGPQPMAEMLDQLAGSVAELRALCKPTDATWDGQLLDLAAKLAGTHDDPQRHCR